MSEILFIRHGETDLAGTFCGHSDPPLNARGEQQVRDLVASLDPHSISCVYSSDLQRATATARPIANAFQLPLMLNSDLREIGFGEWEGLTWAAIEQRDPAHARRWIAEFPHLPAPGGETFAAFESRVLSAINTLASAHEKERIAIVTHGGVLRLALRTFQGCSEAEAWSRTQAFCATFACSPMAELQEVAG